MRVIACLALTLVAAFLGLATGVAQAQDPTLRGDYDGDTKADLAVCRSDYDANTWTWWIWKSAGGFDVRQWGQPRYDSSYPSDSFVPADYDGDNKADLAVWRQFTGVWWIWKSTGGFDVRAWGQLGDGPVPADYDGDTKADLAVVRIDSGTNTITWWIWKSTGGFDVRQWGQTYDRLAPADYDGDTKADLAIFRGGEWPDYPGMWWIWKSTGGFDVKQWGRDEYNDDRPRPRDYDGDTKADLAICRQDWHGNTWTWWIWKSAGGFDVRQWGQAQDDFCLPRDYDGDTKADVAVFRHHTGVWWIWKSTGGFDVRTWGQPADSVPYR